MAATFNRFLRRMTGPARLRSALRSNTLPLFALLTAVNSAGSVGMKLPAAVLGGDIFGVMSKRLRRLLEVTTPAERPSNGFRATRQIAIEDFASRESRNALPTTRDESRPGYAIGPANSEGRTGIRETRLDTATISGDIPARDSPFVSQLEAAPGSVFPLPATIATRDVRHVSEGSEANASRKRNSRAGAPLLETKLRRYWELNQASPSYEPSPKELNAAGDSPQPSVTRFPASLGFNPTSRPWPDFVGREISRKARAASGPFTGNASSGMAQEPSEKVEIQNVFNIEVRNEVNSTNGFDDLSERITEILNEQALQHGIDVT